MMRILKASVLLTILSFSQARAVETHTYKVIGGQKLKAHVFRPSDSEEKHSALVLFHGGGWTQGTPEWVFPTCQHFARRGVVAVAAQYRLSGSGKTTPVDAMEDARSVIKWMRERSNELKIDPTKLIAGGMSAGGHLAASAAVFAKSGLEQPNALLLWFPAVDVVSDAWFAKLLGGVGKPEDYSPAEHIVENLPPTIIFQGDKDVVTPIKGARLFCDRMKMAQNRCDLVVYPGKGHIFTDDAKAYEDTLKKSEAFLASEDPSPEG